MSIEAMQAVWRYSASHGRARLVLLAIADHQGEIGAWPSIATLAKMVNASERSVQRDLRELAEMGELIIEPQQAPTRGKYRANRYWVNLSAIQTGAIYAADGTESLGVTNTALGVTNETLGVTDSTLGVTTVGALTLNRTITEPLKEYSDERFAMFWNIYPRKAGKQAAQRAFAKALNVATIETIIAGATRFAADPNLPPKQFIPHPATWLNGGCWDDEPLPDRGNNKNRALATEWFRG